MIMGHGLCALAGHHFFRRCKGYGGADLLEKRIRVALVDFSVDGHHAEYATRLEHELQTEGVETVAVGSPEFVRVMDPSGTSLLRGVVTLDMNPARHSLLGNIVIRIMCLRKVAAIARRYRCDVVHLLSIDGYVLPVVVAMPFFRNIGICGTLHAAAPTKVKTDFQHRVGQKLTSICVRRFARSGGVLMCHSMRHASALRQQGGTVLYVPFPSLCSRSEPGEAELLRGAIRGSLGIRNSDRLLLLFGPTSRYKGIRTALEVLSLLPEQYHLLLAGQETEVRRDDIMERSTILGVSSRLHLHLSFVPQTEVEGYFVASDVVLIPYSEDFRGQSGPLIIAAALGIPVVASRVEVLADTIAEYDIGKTFNPGDAQDCVRQIISVSGNRLSEATTQHFVSVRDIHVYAKTVQVAYKCAERDRSRH